MKPKDPSQHGDIQVISSETKTLTHLAIPEFESSPRWVRTVLGGVTIADSKQVMILRQAKRLPVYYFPKEDVRMDLMEVSQHSAKTSAQGEMSFWNIKVDETITENAAWAFLDPPDEWKKIEDYIAAAILVPPHL